jgi:UDP-3-O-[3-hydroxymyristoyl] glucosamine N-acyltransferase
LIDIFMNRFSASDIASFLNRPLIGDDFEINRVCSIKKLRSNSVCFAATPFSLVNAPLNLLVLTTQNNFLANYQDCSYVSVINPREAFAKVVERFFYIQKSGISPSAVIGNNVTIGEGVFVGNNVIIEHDCNIGNNTSVDHGSVIGVGTLIGSNCRIGAGVVIGNEGLGSFFDSSGRLMSIRHLGCVIIQDNVEIGPSSTIARGTIDETFIGENTHIGPQVNIGHNSIIGINCFIAGRSHISGSVMIGANCRLMANCTIKDYVKVANNSTIGMGARVIHDVPEGVTVASLPAIDLKQLAKFVHMVKWGS